MCVNLGGRCIDPPVQAKRKSHSTVYVHQGEYRERRGRVQGVYREDTGSEGCIGRL